MKSRRAAIGMVIVTEAIDQELVGRAQCQASLQVSVFILKYGSKTHKMINATFLDITFWPREDTGMADGPLGPIGEA